MFAWQPPPGTKAVFSIARSGVPNELLRDFYDQFGLKLSHDFHSIPLDDPRLQQLLERIDRSTGTPERISLEACWIEEPPPKPSDPSAWFTLSPGATEFRSPAKAPTTMHFGWRDGVYYASARFREAVESASLAGLGWLPLPESRGDDPMPWYEVYAERPIGRGLDHPLLNTTLHEAELGSKFDPARRWGCTVVWDREIRKDARIDHPLVQRLRDISPKYFRVVGPKRFVREHLPPVHFAYEAWGAKRDMAGSGYANRPVRTICCNAEARGILIKAGLMKPSRFDALATVPAESAGVAILDRTVPHPLPLPAYTREEAAAEKARRDAARAPSIRPRPTFASIEDAVADLESRIHNRTAKWTPARDDADFSSISGSELFARTPESWRRIAPLLPISLTGDEQPSTSAPAFEFQMCVPEWNDWLSEGDDREPEDQPSRKDLVIGGTSFGDWFAVRMGDPLLPRDARVVHWDHETTSIADEWPSVAAFAAEIIAACDQVAGR